MSAALRLVEGSSMDKSKALDAALSQIERSFGKGSIMRLGKNDKSMDVETISSGSLSLDIALGVGGVPRGRIIEIFGPESSGKTTLVYHIMAEAQARGGVCAFVDTEHAIDPTYARTIGGSDVAGATGVLIGVKATTRGAGVGATSFAGAGSRRGSEAGLERGAVRRLLPQQPRLLAGHGGGEPALLQPRRVRICADPLLRT